MAEYKLNPNELATKMRTNYKRVYPIIGVSIGSGLVIGIIQNPILLEKPVFFIILIAIVSAAALLGIIMGKSLFKKTYNAVSFAIDEFKFTAKNDGIVLYTIDKDQIKSISKFPNTNLLILTTTNPRKILLTKSIVNYEDLQDELSKLHIIEAVEKQPFNWLYIAAPIPLICLAIYKLTNDQIISLIAGSCFIIICILSLIFIWKSKTTNLKIKLSSLVTLIPIADIGNEIIKRI